MWMPISKSAARNGSRPRRATPAGVMAKYAKLVSSASEGAVTNAAIEILQFLKEKKMAKMFWEKDANPKRWKESASR